MQRQDLCSSIALFENSRSAPMVDDPSSTLSPTRLLSHKRSWIRIPRKSSGKNYCKNNCNDGFEDKLAFGISKTPSCTDTCTEFSIDSHSPPPPPKRKNQSMKLERPIHKTLEDSFQKLDDLFADKGEESESEKTMPYPPPCPFTTSFVEAARQHVSYKEVHNDNQSERSMDDNCLTRFEDSFSIHSSFGSGLSLDLEGSITEDWDSPSFDAFSECVDTASQVGSIQSTNSSTDKKKRLDDRRRHQAGHHSSSGRSLARGGNSRQRRLGGSARLSSKTTPTDVGSAENIHYSARRRRCTGEGDTAVRARASVAGTAVLKPTHKVLPEEHIFSCDSWQSWF